VTYRGTESLDNWMVDFDSVQTNYDIWPECNCKVHAGFNDAVKSVADDVITEVRRL
jgi:hypothetical protein